MITDLSSLREGIDVDNDILKVSIVASEIAFGLDSSDSANEVGVLTALPSFSVGTTQVPRDMVAQIHKDEMIIPKTFSDGIRGGALGLSSTSGLEIGMLSDIRQYTSDTKIILEQVVGIQRRLLRIEEEKEYT